MIVSHGVVLISKMMIILTHIIAVGNIENIELSVTDLLPCGIENACGMNGTFTAKLLKVFKVVIKFIEE